MSNKVWYKDSWLAKGSKAYELYQDARYGKDPKVKKEAEKKLKAHLKEVDDSYNKLHGYEN